MLFSSRHASPFPEKGVNFNRKFLCLREPESFTEKLFITINSTGNALLGNVSFRENPFGITPGIETANKKNEKTKCCFSKQLHL